MCIPGYSKVQPEVKATTLGHQFFCHEITAWCILMEWQINGLIILSIYVGFSQMQQTSWSDSKDLEFMQMINRTNVYL